VRGKQTPHRANAAGVSARSRFKHSVEVAGAGPREVLASPGDIETRTTTEA